MLSTTFVLFLFFLILSGLFSASETSFLASSPYTLAHLEKKGSKRARMILALKGRMETLLGTILIGNTLANVATASLATSLFVSLLADENQAVLLSTAATTLLLLFFAEFNPKRIAAARPHQTAFLLVHPIRLFVILFYPFVKVFAFLSNLLIRTGKDEDPQGRVALSEEETKILLASGVKGLSNLRKKMITEILDIGSRPVKDIMTPRPKVVALNVESTSREVLETIRSCAFTRFPVYRGRMDNVEGVLHARDTIPYLIDNKEFEIKDVLRPPIFVPESASMEKVMLELQEKNLHQAVVVDEFGNMEGIVTLEDIIEEIVGEIEDEYDGERKDWLSRVDERTYLLLGASPVKDINRRLSLGLPEKKNYSTLAGFLLDELGRIPAERDSLVYRGHLFTVAKMAKRHISLVRVRVGEDEEPRA
ncbi:MAG: HlyC/CorC family transporter [Candidatus Aminicenantes bacterium]|nr:HlyC/CorC family transporter [Candidatus Aminicenantes bacterium]